MMILCSIDAQHRYVTRYVAEAGLKPRLTHLARAHVEHEGEVQLFAQYPALELRRSRALPLLMEE